MNCVGTVSEEVESMSFNPFNLLFTLIGGLILAALLGWIRRPRLVMHVPRLFSYSLLTLKGQLVEISVFNRGFKTEETIEVSLNPNLSYEVIGTNSQDVSLTGNKVLIPRLGAGDDVTTLILVENGIFTSADITNCLSKESKGTLVSKLEEVPPTGSQRIQIVGVFVAFPAIIYLGYLLITGYFESEIKAVGKVATELATESATKSATRAAAAATSTSSLQGWNVANAYASINGPLYQAFKAGSVDASVGLPVRKKDVLSIPVILKNSSDTAIQASLSMNSQRSAEKLASYERSKTDIFVSPGAIVTSAINVVVPAQTTNELDKNVYIELFIKDFSGDTLMLKRMYKVDSLRR